jgi:hypothetical protein
VPPTLESVEDIDETNSCTIRLNLKSYDYRYHASDKPDTNNRDRQSTLAAE